MMANPGGSVPAIVQWARGRRNFEFGGIHVPAQLPSFYRSSNGSPTYSWTLNLATPQTELTEYTQPFVSSYHDRFDAWPAFTGYITYDALNMYASVVEDLGGVVEDPVIEELEQRTYTGTAGTIDFHGPNGRYPHDIKYDLDKLSGVFQQWQSSDGQRQGLQEVYWPDRFKTTEYQSPPWLR